MFDTKSQESLQMNFHPQDQPTCDCLQYHHSHLHTHPNAISRIIYQSQQLSFQRQATLCHPPPLNVFVQFANTYGSPIMALYLKLDVYPPLL